MRRLALALSLALLAGCAFAPGQQLDVAYPSLSKEKELDGPVQEDGYTLVPLTPKVMEKLQATGAPKREPFVVPPEWRIDPQKYDYRVGPGDILAVTVWDHPELTNPAKYQTQEGVGQRVSPDGTMFFPYAGTLQVAGKTVEDIRQLIAQALTHYINRPQVDVRVIGFRSKKVNITGAVRQPKELPITDVPLTLVNAINAAGGPTIGESAPGFTLPEADLDDVRVMRDGEQLHVSLLDIFQHARLEENLILQDGDVVYVSDKRNKEVYVMGEVNKPGLLYLTRGQLTLAAALQLSGGIGQENADAERVFVVRAGAKKPVVYHLDANDPSAMLLATQFQLQAHDVVFVSAADVARLRRVLTPIVQAATIAFFGKQF